MLPSGYSFTFLVIGVSLTDNKKVISRLSHLFLEVHFYIYVLMNVQISNGGPYLNQQFLQADVLQYMFQMTKWPTFE